MNKQVFVIVLAMCAALSAVAEADSPPPPVRLTEAKRVEAFGRALRIANLAPVANPPTAAHYTLTPAAPTNSGAQITVAGPGVFMMTQATGSFLLQPHGGPSAISMTIPTDSGKTYVVDCSINYNSLVGFSVLKTTPVPTQHVPADAGHAVWAFRAASASSVVRMETVGPQVVSFFGCEVTRME
jgi:hypothetical protein